MKSSTFVLGLAVGSVAAAVTVLYSTPKSGPEVRNSLKSASSDMKGKIKNVNVQLAQLKNSISQLSKEVKSNVTSTIEEKIDCNDGWKPYTEPTRERLEKEVAAIQAALDDLEKTVAGQHL